MCGHKGKGEYLGQLARLGAVAAQTMMLVCDVWDEGPHVYGETLLIFLEFFDTCMKGGVGREHEGQGCAQG